MDNFSPLLEPAVCADCPAPARECRGNRGPYPSRCAACTRKASTAAAVARSAHHAAAPERKACRSCRVVKPIVDYAVDRSRRTGYAGICRRATALAFRPAITGTPPGAVSRHERKRIRTARPRQRSSAVRSLGR